MGAKDRRCVLGVWGRKDQDLSNKNFKSLIPYSKCDLGESEMNDFGKKRRNSINVHHRSVKYIFVV